MSKLPDAWRRVEGPDIQAWANANSVALLGIDGVVSVGCEYSNEPPFPVPIPDKWATLPLEVLADILRAAGYIVLAPNSLAARLWEATAKAARAWVACARARTNREYAPLANAVGNANYD